MASFDQQGDRSGPHSRPDPGSWVPVPIPPRLEETCVRAGQVDWLESLPDRVRALARRWELRLGAPFAEGMCSWVAPALLRDGSVAVLKVGMPHMEAEHEIAALRFWDGEGAVRVYEADEELGAMLIERCVPGTPLAVLPEPEQDIVMAETLRRLWKTPPKPHPFRPLAAMIQHWSKETLAARERWVDPGLVQEGLRLFAELAGSAPVEVLLATDLHAGNVLRAEREPWLAIDPKPFVGDPAYDATQHLLNCRERLTSDPEGLVQRFAGLLGVSEDRVRLWTFARLAAECDDYWPWSERLAIARKLAP